MYTSQVLHHLYSLDTSSPDFLRYLYCLIRSDEKEQYLSSLQGLELIRLVDFLDGVRSFPLASFWLTGPHRSLGPPRLPTMFSDDVYTNYEPSVAVTRSCHPCTPFQAI